MADVSRRRFLQMSGLAGVSWLSGCAGIVSKSSSKAHVVVVGGGFAGATAAKTLRELDPGIKVTLIEPKASYITCPGSNWLFAGLTNIENLTVDYRALQDNYAIDVVTGTVSRIEAERRRVVLVDGVTLSYDRLIMAPGIAFRWDTLPGYSEATAQFIPHAWQAGPQTLLLQQQLQAINDGGVVLITVPAEPYRCPPGPYERASLMAWWLKQHKPRAKVIILDAKRSFSKQKLFEAGWAKHFGYGTANSLIEWQSIADNPLVGFAAKSGTLLTEFGDKFQGQVLNIIPPQKAGAIAEQTGLTDASGWCPVEPQSSRSKFHDTIHVIGDAANYAPIPKSAFAANSEAKACALAVVSLLNERPLPEAHWLNTCYSLVTPRHGVSVAGVYKLGAERKIEAIKGAGGVSHLGDEQAEVLEAGFARSAYSSLVRESFA